MRPPAKLPRTIVLACAAALLAVAASRAGAAVVSGTVRTPDATPLAGVDLDFLEAGTTSAVDSDTTDASGAYAVTVPAGTYDIRVTPAAASGFLPQVVRDIVVAADATLDVVLVSAEPVTYAGTLVDRDGAALAGQVVALEQGSATLGSAITSVDGAFAIEVAPGSYMVRLNGGFAFPPNPLVPEYSLRATVPLDLSTDVTETITLPTRRLRGTVVDPDGLPVAGANAAHNGAFTMFGDFSGSVFSDGTVTDALGRFDFVVLPGSYRVQVSPAPGSGLTSFVIQGVEVTGDLQLAVLLQFVGEGTDVVLPPGGTATTDGEGDGATPSDPIETTLVLPPGLGGAVSITETPITTNPPAGFVFLTQQVDVTAPAATTDAPITLIFRLDASRITTIATRVFIFKDGVMVPACSGTPGTADPDPCMASRIVLGDGDLEITILTSSASAWNFGIDVPTTTTTTTTLAGTSTTVQPSTSSSTSASSTSSSSTSSSSTTTSTAPPATSTTSSVTTSTVLTSTTTTLPGICGDQNTLDALACRIAALRDLLAAAPQIDPVRARLLASLDRAALHVADAAALLAGDDAAKGARALKRAGRRVKSMQRLMRTLRTRRAVPDEVRLPLLDEIADVASRVQTLHAVLQGQARGR
jgi:hypothetical protein